LSTCQVTIVPRVNASAMCQFVVVVRAENKQDKLGTSITFSMQSAISSVGLFSVGTCLLGPRRGYLQKGLRSSS